MHAWSRSPAGGASGSGDGWDIAGVGGQRCPPASGTPLPRRPLPARPGSSPRSPLHPPAGPGPPLQPRSSRWASHLPCRRPAPLPAASPRSCFAGGMFGESPSAGLTPERGPRRSPRRWDRPGPRQPVTARVPSKTPSSSSANRVFSRFVFYDSYSTI